MHLSAKYKVSMVKPVVRRGLSIYLPDLHSTFPQICITPKALCKHSLKQYIYRQVNYLTVIKIYFVEKYILNIQQ